MDKSLTPVIAGFIPLLDSAVLVAAAEMGFAEQEGIALKLVRETSWANIRDRIAVGHFDVAHMLAPMPIAASLNLTSLAVPMLAPMLLGLGGNAITVSTSLWADMAAGGADTEGDPASTGRALAAVIESRRSEAAPRLHFGVVHPFSGHAYELRYWIAAAGLDPDRDVEITVLAPQIMADALATGQLDGYCVGEPWNTAAVAAGTGRIATYKQAIWPDSPEKVLGVTRKWAEANPRTLAALLRALSRAADWCASAQNVEQLAGLLARTDMLGCPVEICLPALEGSMRLGRNTMKQVPDFLTFPGGAKMAPMPVHGKWFHEQMVRWGQAERSEDASAEVARIFSPDIYLSALGLENVPRDAPIRMFDGREF
ncbi:CmpA/NrtA family ABC transporter substrate-binding protein [Roseibium marinum]|uniref:NitT/TauT family transport system ATP-binding protein n=1 Tax=Roseibium marinum TaxID=281252 RepID=A0A2S3UV63_9HYPH|nr:CmpA/NrtA family ABC transporter substrate-binding protein [Roseibium marinum]POF31612.1 NitT/TauT family transport system ATP-binding protein [Roseibium marinum]